MDDVLADEIPTPDTPARAGGRNIFQIVWQRAGLVFFCLVLGTTFGVLYYVKKPAVYQSSAQVLVIKKRSDALPISGGDPRLTVYDDYVSTHLTLLRSPLVVEKAVRKRNLGGLKSLAGHPDPVGAIRVGLTAVREVNKDAPANAQNNVIILTYAGSDPGDTEAVLNAVIDSYRDFLDETYLNVSNTTVDQISKASTLLRDDLTEKRNNYREFRTTSPLLPKGGDGTNVHISRIFDLQREETGLLRRQAEVDERLKAIQVARADGQAPDILLALATRPFDKANAPDNGEQALEKSLFPLMLKKKELEQSFGEDYPELVRVNEQIEMTRQLYKKLDTIAKKPEQKDADAGKERVDFYVQALQQEQKLLGTALTALRGLLKEEDTKARKLEAFEIRDREFQDEIALTRGLLTQIQKRLEEISLVRDFGGFDAKVIAPPSPGGKTSPILFQFLVMGAALGAALGFGSAYLLDIADKSFRTPEEIRRRLGLAIVGHIPFSLQSEGRVPVAGPGGESVEIDAGLFAFHQASSPEAEAYRGVRTALYFSTHGQRHKVIQVTSPNMGDGKTTLIANLAVSIAQSGRRVILVDADLRRPRLHRAFGAAGKIGLSDVIAETVELDAAIVPTVVPGLSLLPCGKRPPNPAEVLLSPRLDEILDDLRDRFDYVLVDSPPLMAVSDPCTIAPRVDGLLFTIRVSRNGRPAAERARDMLVGLRVKVLGVVVNGVGKHGAMNGYGHYKYADEYSAEYTHAEADAPALVDPVEGSPAENEAPILPTTPAANGRHSQNGTPARAY